LTILVAKIIVELAKEGERDPVRLRDLALKAVPRAPSAGPGCAKASVERD
jgi:hypothetical protein